MNNPFEKYIKAFKARGDAGMQLMAFMLADRYNCGWMTPSEEAEAIAFLESKL